MRTYCNKTNVINYGIETDFHLSKSIKKKKEKSWPSIANCEHQMVINVSICYVA